MTWQEHVHPHGPVTEVVPGLWYVRGSLPRNPIPRNMAIFRAGDEIIVHSVVALDAAGVEALESIGMPTVMIVPNRMHRSDAPAYLDRYPDLKVVAPRAARAEVEKIVPVAADAEDFLPGLGIQVLEIDGCKPGELVYDIPVEGGRALLVCDLFFNIREHLPGVAGFFIKYVTRSSGFFGITGLGRMMMLKDRDALRAWTERQASRADLRAILVAHGPPITECQSELSAAAARLA